MYYCIRIIEECYFDRRQLDPRVLMSRGPSERARHLSAVRGSETMLRHVPQIVAAPAVLNVAPPRQSLLGDDETDYMSLHRGLAGLKIRAAGRSVADTSVIASLKIRAPGRLTFYCVV